MDAHGQISRLTTTQIGAIGEAVIAAGLMHASQGRLCPFKPYADDDGTDFLVFHKETKKALPIQLKCRTAFDDPNRQTVQFDVRLKTFAREGAGFVLAVVLDQTAVRAAWLLPAQKLPTLARANPEKLIIVACAKTESKDKYRSFRHTDVSSLARAICDALGEGERQI